MMKPNTILSKMADSEKNRVIIPKEFIKKHGRYFQMEVYNDFIKIIPKDIDTTATNLYNQK